MSKCWSRVVLLTASLCALSPALPTTHASEAVPAAGSISAEDLEFFEKSIRPLLVEKCYSCHSADAKKLKGGLLLDSREGIAAGGETGPVTRIRTLIRAV